MPAKARSEHGIWLKAGQRAADGPEGERWMREQARAEEALGNELRAVWGVACLCLAVFAAGEVALYLSYLGR